jgi:hypothetical protein
LIERARHSFPTLGNPSTFVVADMMDHIVAAQVFQPAGACDHVVACHVIPHYLNAEIAPCFDNATNGLFVRSSHYDHMRGAGARHHFGL